MRKRAHHKSKGVVATERHAVFFLMYNVTDAQLELSKQAFDSILAQDIGPLDVYVCNNGSTQPTCEWLKTVDIEQGEHRLFIRHSTHNVSPIKLANDYSATLFEKYDKIFGVPNDAILPPNMYSTLNRWPRGFVTASETRERNFPIFKDARAVSENTPMAVALVRRWFYDAIMAKDGYYFDTESYFHYCSDCDLALRMAACGIRGVQLDIQYYHAGSASWKMATPEAGKAITDQADIDRRNFLFKWGFAVDSLEYGQVAADVNFTGKSKFWIPE